MSAGMYILDGHTPVPCESVAEWSQFYSNHDNRRVAEDFDGIIRISTIFLGLDHSWLPGTRPILFETMIFGGKHDGYQDRYYTWDEAEAGHRRAVAMVVSGEKEPNAD